MKLITEEIETAKVLVEEKNGKKNMFIDITLDVQRLCIKRYFNKIRATLSLNIHTIYQKKPLFSFQGENILS